MMYFFSPVGFS